MQYERPEVLATYTEEELAEYCARRGGWWRPDELMGGHCEFEADGFL